jgi:hypothetical protein
VNAIMNFVVYKMLGNCRVVTQLVASRVLLSSIELVALEELQLATLNVFPFVYTL